MTLAEAIQRVWDDVADCVYRDPTVLDAVNYARDTPTDELAFDDDERGIREAYGLLRDATQNDVDAALSSFDHSVANWQR